MGVVNSIIKKQPLFIKKLYYSIIPFEYRYGNEFSKTYNQIINNLNLPIDKLVDKQFDELKNILIHCDKNVKYYNKLFSDYGLNPYKLQDFKEIKNYILLKLLVLLVKN